MGKSEIDVDNLRGATPVISVRLFGAFEIRRDGAVLTAADLGGCKPRHILEILLLNLGTPVSKTRLVEILWGPRASGGAVATLESYVSGIRRAIQPGNTKTGPLRTANSGYVLDPQLVELDLSAFQQLLNAARHAAPAEAHTLSMQALEMAAEPLLGFELVADWAEEARLRHAAEKVAAQVLAAETAAFLDKPDLTISLAQSAVQAEPLNERAWTILVAGYEQAGLPVEGLSAYERCRRLFDRDLGCTPGPALQAAHLRLLRQRAEGNTELSEVLAALLYLGERLHGPKCTQHPAEESRRMQENAGRVLDSFLQQALAVAV
ncbi:AfsR/SARP family transcriptional regulator [Arthrobacter sp. Leaf69]|uniref:AfsR/SARP family transcriptional regulator n=1 Tax=Arthrobacter sp. Leaf69 TaxID=1736232 RepID=UPI0006FE4F79|nr:BTAD domain-containing putative transcriptional regulator [Arthrobacter sp. Leaf69]KQN91244.1 response regulator receiver protein [Arthrobacter sp. Leaf69]